MMAILKTKDIRKMSKAEIGDKITDLKMELIKNRAEIGKGGKIKIREIKRTIARLHTLHKSIGEKK
jgi:ribosomal protein L29